MADDASYMAFLQKANDNTTAVSSTSSQRTASLDEPEASKHPFLPLLNNKLANISSRTFITETDSDFHAVFISSSSLASWSDDTDAFPSAVDLEGQVDGGRKGKKLSIMEWDPRGEYTAVVKAVKDITKRNAVQVYSVQGKGGRFEVFVLAKMDDGLVGVKAKGVAT
jgi:hypothetical protein